MPFYAARTTVGRRCFCYDADTDEKIDRAESVDTDKGILVEFVSFVDENGKRRMQRQARLGNFYVKDRLTDEVNPPCDDEPPKVGTRREMLRMNNRGRWNRPPWVPGWRDQTMLDVVKRESGLPLPEWLVNPTALPITPYLNEWATKLYETDVGSTVIEYLEGPEEHIVYPPPTFTHAPVPEGHMQDFKREQEKYKDYERKTSLVRFAVKQVTLYGEGIPDSLLERWAKVLNMLADKGIWEFGIMGTAISMPLHVWGDGTPWLSEQTRLVNPKMPKNDPRSIHPRKEPVIVTPEDIKERGRRVALLAYLGVHPDHEQLREDGWDIANDVLNELIGNKLFVDEGNAGNDDWDNLPE